MKSEAIFSEDNKYRYLLYREWETRSPTLCWVMLNPSLANAHENDPTIRRVIGFSSAMGFGSIYVVNLFALVTPYPTNLWCAEDPIGPDNIKYIRKAFINSDKIICAWGNGASRARDLVIDLKKIAASRALYCFGLTSDKQPKHPLYLPKTSTLSIYSL